MHFTSIVSKQILKMIPSTAPVTILVATPLDIDDAKHLLNWAISIFAHPNYTIIALHVIGN